ncbi:MAG TPA: type II CAAX endopeptidase family protein [Gemmatimonadaceae bacterium]|nr:type II CAAX endopeptidase family protein [Gemmatimonadaceae bacterium]
MKVNRFQTTDRSWRYAAVTLAVFLAGVHLIPFFVDLLLPSLHGYARSAAVKTLQTALPIAVLLLVLPRGAGGALAELGLRGPLRRALVIAFMAALPMLVVFALTGALRAEYSLLVLAVSGLFSPVAEEVLFRGYAFGQLRRRAGWSFWPAILVPTLFFSAGHLYQADGLLAALGIFGVTAIGSVWFAWLYVRWNNLWVPIALHSFMNVAWYVFEVDTTALGGWVANIARLATIGISIVLTLNHHRLRKGAQDTASAGVGAGGIPTESTVVATTDR